MGIKIIPAINEVKSKIVDSNDDELDVNDDGSINTKVDALGNDISTNSNTQLKVTNFDSSGNEGQKIIGVDYLSGNSGIDSSTETLQTIEYEHHEIHSGSHFNYCDYALNQSASAVIDFIIVTPNTTKWAHMTFNISSSEGATLEFYVAPTGIVGGTAITPRNNNANSATASVLTITKDPTTITADGTRVAGYLAGGGKTAGQASRSNEIILAQNTTYLVRISSLAVSNDISWCTEWYEHTNKN